MVVHLWFSGVDCFSEQVNDVDDFIKQAYVYMGYGFVHVTWRMLLESGFLLNAALENTIKIICGDLGNLVLFTCPV